MSTESGARLRSELDLSSRFSPSYLSEYGIFPLRHHDGALEVAVRDGEADEGVVQHLERAYGVPVRVFPASIEQLTAAIVSSSGVYGSPSQESEFTPADSQSDQGLGQVSQPPVIRLVQAMVTDAIRARASDVHIESTESGLQLRRRIDGVLEELPPPPRAMQAAVISRLKLLAELNIAEHRRPQDGHFRVRVDGSMIDVRVSTVPTLFGESVVLRLLDQRVLPGSLRELGFDATAVDELTAWAHLPHGLILTTGPTGSGKTTTLHRLLMLRAGGRDKVITVEDPVEYTVAGVTQVPVVEAAGVTFATVLRSVLRQDPDVVMVGEMRDLETARIAVRAALTGHLVLSTLHTNDAVSAIVRLRDIGLEGYLLSAALRGVVAQRLVRRLCERCRCPATPEPSEWTAVGCAACAGTGYSGRAALFELLPTTDALLTQLASGANDRDIAEQARRDGFRSLSEDAAEKIRRGITSRHEVLRALTDIESELT